MSERQTGATEEQLNEAILRERSETWECEMSPTDPAVEPWLRRGAVENRSVDEWARHLIPPGYVIARAEDVPTPELRAALRKALLDLETGYRLMPGSMSWEADHEDIAVIERWMEASS